MSTEANSSAPSGESTQTNQTTQPTQPSESIRSVWGDSPPPAQTQQSTQSTAQPTQTVQQSAAPAQTTTQPPVASAQPPVANPLSDPRAFAEAVRAAAAGMVPQQASGQQPVQPSDADLRRQLNVFEATEEMYEQILGVKPDNPARLAAFNNVLQGVVRQAVTMANIMAQNHVQTFQQSINPYIETVRSQEVDRQKSLFFTENKDLTGYDAIVEAEFQLAKAEGRRFPDVATARKYVADRARDRLRAINITPGAAAQTPPQSTTTAPRQPSRQMTTTSVGGRAGGSANTGKPANNVQAVWG